MNKKLSRFQGRAPTKAVENIDVSHVVPGARVLVSGPGVYSGFLGLVNDVTGPDNAWCSIKLDSGDVVKVMRQDLTHIQTESSTKKTVNKTKVSRTFYEGLSLLVKNERLTSLSSKLKASKIPHCLEKINKLESRIRVLSVRKADQDKAVSIGMRENSKIARFSTLDFIRNANASNPSGVTVLARSLVTEQSLQSKVKLTTEQLAIASRILIAGQKCLKSVRESIENKPQSAGYEVRMVGDDSVVKTFTNCDEARAEVAGRTDMYVCPIEPKNVVEDSGMPLGDKPELVLPDSGNRVPATAATYNACYSSPGYYVVNMEGVIMEGPYGDYEEGSTSAAAKPSPSFVQYLDDDNLMGNLDYQPMEDELIGDGNQYMSQQMDDGGVTNESKTVNVEGGTTNE